MKTLKIKDVPKITKDNFEDFTNKYVKRVEFDYRVFEGIEKPKNDKEFAEISKKLYGTPLHVTCYVYPYFPFGENGDKYCANYRVKEKHDDLAKTEIYKLWENKYSQYDGLKVLLDWCFGDVGTGGVAGSHYGQTKLETEEDYERIKNWGNQKENYNQARKEQDNSLKEIFGFNPFN